MKQKLISMSILAAVVAFSGAPVWAQAPGTQDKSVGGTQDKRTGGDQQTPLPQGSRSAGETGAKGEIKGTTPSPGAQTQDKSVGGTQDKRLGQDQPTPAPQGSRSAGGTGPQGEMKADKPASGRMAGERRGSQDIKQAQEALKNKGHDPGPIDGILGSQTRQAIKAFQGSNGLKETGNLDSETSKKLGVEKGGSAMGSTPERGMGSPPDKGTSAREPSSPGKAESSSMEKSKSPRGEDQGQKTEPSSPMGK